MTGVIVAVKRWTYSLAFTAAAFAILISFPGSAFAGSIPICHDPTNTCVDHTFNNKGKNSSSSIDGLSYSVHIGHGDVDGLCSAVQFCNPVAGGTAITPPPISTQPTRNPGRERAPLTVRSKPRPIRQDGN